MDINSVLDATGFSAPAQGNAPAESEYRDEAREKAMSRIANARTIEYIPSTDPIEKRAEKTYRELAALVKSEMPNATTPERAEEIFIRLSEPVNSENTELRAIAGIVWDRAEHDLNRWLARNGVAPKPAEDDVVDLDDAVAR